MKFLPLIWSGIWRKPGRTILIFLQVSVAFALFGVLQGLKTGVAHAVAAARADLLLVHSRQSYILQPLPLGLLDEIRSVPGVRVAIPVELTGATYQKPTEGIGIVAVSPEDDWPSAFTYTIAPEYLAAFRKSRTAMLIRDTVREKYGWKVGDHIPLKMQIAQRNGSSDWAFDVVGTFTDSDVGGGRYIVLISFPYFDEARAAGKGTVNHFNVAVSDPKLAVTVSDAIDRRFANSSHETKTESLRELAQANVQRIGDFDFLLRAVVGAVLVALLFATTTMMIQSTRERTPELAVVKTLGFTDRAVFLLILAEALVIFLGGAALGLALATLTLPIAAKFVLGLSMPGVVVVIGLVSGMLIALVSAAVPAALAARLRVATALAGHGAA
ncbi:MAG: FtsX-like permease family protein [Gammaproteobacteria bacterium]|nr:MAG: FtsX-like permease family protein [Gammaproteobacteria bacterium]